MPDPSSAFSPFTFRVSRMFSPQFPRRCAVFPEVLQKVLVPQRIHRLPETVVLECTQFPSCSKSLQRFLFQHTAVIAKIPDNLGLHDEETGIDPVAVPPRLLLEA